MSWKRGCGTSTVTKGRWNALLQGMTRKRAAGCPKPQHPSVEKASLSRSEEFLTRISTELTNEALFIAGYHMNPVPTKEKQTQDRGTQISKHVFFTKTRGTDTRSDRNRTHTKAHLLPSPRDKELRTQKEMIQSLSLKSSQCSVAPVKLMANYNIKWMSVPNRNGNSGKSTYPSLSWDRKERNHGVPTERIFREKNRELCLAA
ncbi:uncharacterized protein LOC112481569 isoform X1 [Pteropus alecto]|uniref:uncharacterized protein LOC112481569 isoform X1 n=2 Tax=Pteropus alecto TaxID=9402 RepID=UPI000D53635D|nr:uncharacterized protein LOC112481569 isoform X1 [Pteropus alecto]